MGGTRLPRGWTPTQTCGMMQVEQRIRKTEVEAVALLGELTQQQLRVRREGQRVSGLLRGGSSKKADVDGTAGRVCQSWEVMRSKVFEDENVIKDTAAQAKDSWRLSRKKSAHEAVMWILTADKLAKTGSKQQGGCQT